MRPKFDWNPLTWVFQLLQSGICGHSHDAVQSSLVPQGQSANRWNQGLKNLQTYLQDRKPWNPPGSIPAFLDAIYL